MMKTNGNSNKDELLGMSHGTAAHRLRKEIMFSFLRKLNLDICFVCGKRIESSSEMSIEHKSHWQQAKNPREAFFDLDNISFSHLKCNTPDRELIAQRERNIGPEGTEWCSRHQKFLPKERFGSNVSRWNQVGSDCLECTAKYKAESRDRIKGRKR